MRKSIFIYPQSIRDSPGIHFDLLDWKRVLAQELLALILALKAMSRKTASRILLKILIATDWDIPAVEECGTTWSLETYMD